MITYLEIVGEVTDTLTLAQLEDLEAIVSAQIKARAREYRDNGAYVDPELLTTINAEDNQCQD